MKTRFVPLALSLLFAASFAAAFEGNITYELSDGGPAPHQMDYQIKGDRLRMNMEQKGGRGVMLVVPEEKAVYILVPDQKMAMKNRMPDEKAAPGGKTAKADFRKTNRHETIAGQDCTVYEYTSEQSQGEVCNAEGMGTFFFGGARGGEVPAWAREARAKGLFPLRTTNKDLASGRTMTMIAKKIEKKSLPDALFQVPADYRVMEGFGPGAPMGTGRSAGAGAPPMDPAEMAKRMQNATPEARQKMIEEMQKAYGAPRK